MKQKFVFLYLILLFLSQSLYAQIMVVGNAQDSVYLLSAGKYESVTTASNTRLEILVGNVRIKQGNTLFTCDSCVLNPNSHVFEAFGKVFINDNDTTKIWSNTLRYLTDKKYAYLNGNVKLTDGHATLTTNTLEYDAANKIATYKNGGRVLNKKTVLTSREGIYYSDIKDFYFKNNVELKDPGYTLKSDSLLYNTESQMARFIANTFIRDSSGRTIRTKEGYYDLRTGQAQFTQRTTIQDKAITLSGDRIASDDSAGIVQVEGRGVLIDTAQGISVLANRIFLNKKTEAFLATQKPLMIIRQDKDSIYIAADTLYSARLTDLVKDTSKISKPDSGKKDSTNRYFEAYRHVRVFSDSLQAVSDSLFYSFKDSVFRLFQDPVVWTNKNQITGDTIYLQTKNKKAEHLKVNENSFLVSEVQPGVYNQIKSTRMNGFFKDGKIDSVQARGFSESIYFLQDKDSAYTGVNQTTSDAIDIYFLQAELYKVVLRSSVKGTLFPVSYMPPSQMRLTSFQWYASRRPKNKYELFE